MQPPCTSDCLGKDAWPWVDPGPLLSWHLSRHIQFPLERWDSDSGPLSPWLSTQSASISVSLLSLSQVSSAGPLSNLSTARLNSHDLPNSGLVTYPSPPGRAKTGHPRAYHEAFVFVLVPKSSLCPTGPLMLPASQPGLALLFLSFLLPALQRTAWLELMVSQPARGWPLESVDNLLVPSLPSCLGWRR